MIQSESCKILLASYLSNVSANFGKKSISCLAVTEVQNNVNAMDLHVKYAPSPLPRSHPKTNLFTMS